MKKHLFLASILLSLMFNYSFAQQTIPKDTLISLERDHGFFGFMSPCPFYKFTISADGIVEIEPKVYKNENDQYRIVSGEIIKAEISREQVKQIVSELEKIDFYSLKDIYDGGMENQFNDCPFYASDSPKAVISFRSNGKSKTVIHDYGCSGTSVLSKLRELENKIAEIVNVKRWVSCRTGKI